MCTGGSTQMIQRTQPRHALGIFRRPWSHHDALGYAEQALEISRANAEDAIFWILWPLAPPIWAVRRALRPDFHPYGRTCPCSRPRARKMLASAKAVNARVAFF